MHAVMAHGYTEGPHLREQARLLLKDVEASTNLD